MDIRIFNKAFPVCKLCICTVCVLMLIVVVIVLIGALHDPSSSSKNGQHNISPALTTPDYTAVIYNDKTLGNIPLVFFDLETCGFGKTVGMTQISASVGAHQYNQYILPNSSITPGASRVTKLTIANDTLLYKGRPVPSTDTASALVGFIEFIKAYNKSILVGHNIAKFDIPILKHHLQTHNLLEEFSNYIHGCLDTLLICKSKYEKGTLPGQVPDYKQPTLVATLLGSTYEAHNAMDDVKSLQELYRTKLDMDAELTEEYIFIF